MGKHIKAQKINMSYEELICDYMNRILKAIEDDKKQRPINITINIESKDDFHSHSLAESVAKNIKTKFTLEGFDSLDNNVENLLKQLK
ncbi:hypothetical protein CF086_16860 [Clostridium botulinum]|uniref:hypothetical protein n=1 Tax=Clostridium botulinum TaxID=1491 RepID=UPI000772E076|nr:hypothetical protein [Clostridium botulinum]MBN3351966.1 hypothetical protein [Clostridium botulinum]